MTAAERKALVEKKLAEARAKIAQGLIDLAVVVDPEVLLPPEAPTEPTPEPQAPILTDGQ